MTGNDRDPSDDALRSRFAALRREEDSRTPEFRLPEFSARPDGGPQIRRPRSVRRLLAATACLAAVIAAVLWLRPAPPRPQPSPGSPVASITEWRPPTGFLLETPGRELLRTVPAIGAWPGPAVPPQQRQKHPQAGKQVSP